MILKKRCSILKPLKKKYLSEISELTKQSHEEEKINIIAIDEQESRILNLKEKRANLNNLITAQYKQVLHLQLNIKDLKQNHLEAIALEKSHNLSSIKRRDRVRAGLEKELEDFKNQFNLYDASPSYDIAEESKSFDVFSTLTETRKPYPLLAFKASKLEESESTPSISKSSSSSSKKNSPNPSPKKKK